MGKKQENLNIVTKQEQYSRIMQIYTETKKKLELKVLESLAELKNQEDLIEAFKKENPTQKQND